MAQIRPKYLSSGLPYIRFQACCLCTKVSGRTRVQVASIPETDNYPTYRLADKMTTTTTLLLPLLQNASNSLTFLFKESVSYVRRRAINRQSVHYSGKPPTPYGVLTQKGSRMRFCHAISAPAILSLLKLGKVGRFIIAQILTLTGHVFHYTM